MKSVFETRFARVGETGTHYQRTKINSTKAAIDWALSSLGSWCILDAEKVNKAITDKFFNDRHDARVASGNQSLFTDGN